MIANSSVKELAEDIHILYSPESAKEYLFNLLHFSFSSPDANHLESLERGNRIHNYGELTKFLEFLYSKNQSGLKEFFEYYGDPADELNPMLWDMLAQASGSELYGENLTPLDRINLHRFYETLTKLLSFHFKEHQSKYSPSVKI